jgi:hypothetical protein
MHKDTDKNLKDSPGSSILSVKDTSFSISYTKTNKLITALYMVTDIIDKEEPIRNKLRTLGAEIISDMHSIPAQATNKITETVSFLNIASAMNFISEMNCAILKKEFIELKGSIHEYVNMKPWLSEFFLRPHSTLEEPDLKKVSDSLPQNIKKTYKGHTKVRKGHEYGTSIGVQKGSTLMKALSDKAQLMSDSNVTGLARNNFDILKKQRQEYIKNAIKSNIGGVTIKDIKIKINSGGDGAPGIGEKTLQRELASMIKDGVLYKTGEKRWSRYFIKN